jgi:tRNA pseudouridine55 synthase
VATLGKNGGMAESGLVVVDKPAGWTSHDVVGRMRRIAHTRRVGHAGTLDPMATGVLLVGVERVTKLLGYLSAGDKAYDATVRLGQSTVTDDAEGGVTAEAPAKDVTEDAVRAAFARYTGDLMQVPSSVSAVKVEGRRSYERVRSGEQVELAARPVTVSRLDVGTLHRPSAELLDVDISLTCSSGTYVRAIARDVGADLGVGGHLTALRRTRVGAFDLTEALNLDALAELDDPIRIGLDALVERVFGRRDIGAEQARIAANGGRLAPVQRAEPYGVFDPDGHAIAVMQERDGAARPLVVLRPA